MIKRGESAYDREILINIHVGGKLARFININSDCDRNRMGTRCLGTFTSHTHFRDGARHPKSWTGGLASDFFASSLGTSAIGVSKGIKMLVAAICCDEKYSVSRNTSARLWKQILSQTVRNNIGEFKMSWNYESKQNCWTITRIIMNFWSRSNHKMKMKWNSMKFNFKRGKGRNSRFLTLT